MTSFDKSSITRDWASLGKNVKLKVSSVYELTEKIGINRAIHFAGCSYGGPIALAVCLPNTSWEVTIRTSSGKSLVPKPFLRGDIIALAWSRAQRLLVLDRRGCVNRYKTNGKAEGSFYFSADIREVLDHCVFNYGTSDTGMAILDDQYRIFVVNSVKEAIPWLMQSPSSERPTAWCALHGSSLTSVVVAHGIKFLWGQQGEPMRPLPVLWAERDGEYLQMIPNWSTNQLALYHSKKKIQITSLDFSKVPMTIPVPGDGEILRFGWVGSNAVFLQRTHELIQFFATDSPDLPHEHTSDYSQIVIEPDGIRLHGEKSATFIGPVSSSELDVLGVASGSGGAFLFEASLLAERGKAHRAFEHLTLMVPDMNKAISECISAACHSMAPALQKMLLKAARFGVPFCNSFDATTLVRTISLLRIINEVRLPRTGIPITYAQLEELSVKSLVSRLVDQGSFGVAARISGFAEETKADGQDAVLLAWVKALFESVSGQAANVDMTLLDEKIARKFQEFPHVSFGDAARKAIEAGLPHLARLLIKREMDEEKQVAILLALQDVNDALRLAAKAQRPELMHQVIRHLIKQKNKMNYELEIQKIPQAQSLYAEYITQKHGGSQGDGSRKMQALLEQQSDYDSLVLFYLDAAQQADPTLMYEEHLNALKSAKNVASQMKDNGINELLSMAVGQVSADWNVNTARQRIIENANDPAIVQSTKQLMKLSDKQVTLWTIEGLAAKGCWEQLFNMANKRSPYGIAPFIEACVKCGNRQQAERYLSRIGDYRIPEQVAAYMSLGEYVKAAKLAYDANDRELVQRVYCRSHSNRDERAKVAQLMNAM